MIISDYFIMGADIVAELRNRDYRTTATRNLVRMLTPISVLCGHSNQRLNIGSGWRPARLSVPAAIVFLRDQFPMPCQQRFRCDDRCETIVTFFGAVSL